MSDEKDKKGDWSARHARLRIELLLLTLLIFLYAFYKAKIQTIVGINFDSGTIPADHILIGSFIIWSYLLFHFIIRSQSELDNITDEKNHFKSLLSENLTLMVGYNKIQDDIMNKKGLTLENIDGYLFSQFKETLNWGGHSDGPVEETREKTLMLHLKKLENYFDHYNLSKTESQSAISFEVDAINQFIKDKNVMSDRLYKEANAINEAKKYLADFMDEIVKIQKDIVERHVNLLKAINANDKNFNNYIERQKRGISIFGAERLWLSYYGPVAISIVATITSFYVIYIK